MLGEAKVGWFKIKSVQYQSNLEVPRSAANDLSVFDDSAQQFARTIDENIQAGRYLRGRLFVDAVKKHLPPKGSVLDYGCGPGRIAHLLAKSGFQVIGVDRSVAMIGEARALLQENVRLRFECDDGESVWHLAQGYDAVVCSSVIEYVEDYMHLLKRLRECLRPDGVLVISFANRRSLWRKYAEIQTGNEAAHFAVQHNVWTWQQCRIVLAQAGFSVVNQCRYFDSIFDNILGGAALSRLSIIGSLGLLIARPKWNSHE